MQKMNTIVCPHCGTKVLPKSDGTCPSCRKMISQEEVVVESDKSQNNHQRTHKKQNNKRAWVVALMFLLIIISFPLNKFVIHPWSDRQNYWGESGQAIYLLNFEQGTSLGLHQALIECGLPENLANLDTLEKAGISYADREPIVYSYKDGEFFMFATTQVDSGIFKVKCSSYIDTNGGTPPVIHIASWQEMGGNSGGVFTSDFSASLAAVHFEIQVRNSPPKVMLIFTAMETKTQVCSQEYVFAASGLISDNISFKCDKPEPTWSIGMYQLEVLCLSSPNISCDNDVPLYIAEYKIK